MKIGAIAPWFGSKRTLATAIIEELGPHRAYWEPFCGSCAVLLAKPPASQETVNDLHRDQANLAMVLASDRCRDLYDRLVRTLMSEALFNSARAQIVNDPDVPAGPGDVTETHVSRAWAYMVAAWMGRNGHAGTPHSNCHLCVRYTPNGGGAATRWRSVVDSVPDWHDRLRNVTILNRDGFDIIAKIADQDGVALYVDPPYFKDTRGSGRKSARGGGSNYTHDFDDPDHARLADALNRFERARVVVSYYDSPRLDLLYPGWRKQPVYCQKNLHVQNRRGPGACQAPEVLLVNQGATGLGF